MSYKLFRAVILAVIAFSAQAAEIPRTPAGKPNLDGLWFYGTATPFERPIELGTQLTYSAEESKLLLAQLAMVDSERFKPSDPDRPPPKVVKDVGQEADDNFAISRTNLTRIDSDFRTSLIVDPPNGRLPYRQQNQDIFEIWKADGHGDFDGPEVRPASERCLNVTGPAAPMVSWYFNANLRIVQTDDHIVMQGEMLKPRILNFTHAAPLASQGWQGQSSAHWDGDVLVVESNNFRPEISWFRLKSSDQLKVTEYFELISEDEILYRYTLEDPAIYTTTHTVEMNLTRRGKGVHMFEFACHEHNHSLPAILRGARFSESTDLLDERLDSDKGLSNGNPR